MFTDMPLAFGHHIYYNSNIPSRYGPTNSIRHCIAEKG